MRIALALAEIAARMLNSARPSPRRCKCFDIDRTPCCGRWFRVVAAGSVLWPLV